MTVVPESAWVQAVFVCLFIAFVVLLLNWFGKQQDKWQKFIDARDEQWQRWMDRAELRTAAQMRDVTNALGRLADKLDIHDKRVIEALDEHDERVRERERNQ